MSGWVSHRGLLLSSAGAGAASLYDEIMADSPVHYWRNAEASGTTMVDEITADGTYVGSVSIGNTAIYTGGPTCAGGNFTSVRHGTSGVTPVALNAITLVSVVQITTASGYQPVGVQRDNNGGGNRKYHWRSNGTGMEFVKIVGGVEVFAQPSVFVSGVTCIVGITIDSSGNYVMYKNGASIKTGSVSATNYGGSGDQLSIGYSAGMAAALDGYTCENAIFDTALSGARMAAYAAAAGF